MLIEPDRTQMPLIPFGAPVIVHRPESLKVVPKGVELLFLGFEPFSDAARFYDIVLHKIIISRDYVVPEIRLNDDSTLIKKDLNSSQVEVITVDSKIPRLVARLPDKLLSADSSADENSSISLNENANGQQDHQHKQESKSHYDSDVLFETEALRVFRRAEERKKQARQQMRAE
jgi:hypothetical protein